jgi:FMN phosphatase YigB (HAD superfamily)/glycosyltransferase involved in cell wall biosynthesis
MRVAILHYHLHHGGVTRVIESSSQALIAAGIQHVVLHGGVIPALGYTDSRDPRQAEKLVADLRREAASALGGAPDLWHFHNHSLGKNGLLPAVIQQLAEAGERLVLQIHDLAEEGRPTNFAAIADCLSLYPIAPQIAYAFVNSRDRENFIQAGLPELQAVPIPNPIPLREITAAAARSIWFAPIRGIRRKNLGELVLLAALAPVGTLVAVSREPLDSAALVIHQGWRDFAHRLNLPIEFAVTDRLAPAEGAAPDFGSWIDHASHYVSTSVAEGFGLPFLEAVAHGKPLVGRNIPHLTAEQNTHSEWLYDRLLVPTDWISPTRLERHLAATLELHCRAYRGESADEFATSVQRLHFDGAYVDFANLPESLQQTVIETLEDPVMKSQLLVEISGNREPAVDWLAHATSDPLPLSPALLDPYSLNRYQENLTNFYQNLLAQAPAPVSYLTPSRILAAYFKPEGFHFLCSVPPKIPFFAATFRAVIFDIYGTLLIAPKTGVKVDPPADPMLGSILTAHGYTPPDSLSSALHAAVLRHHAASEAKFPEVDLRELWREILQLDSDTNLNSLVQEIEANWHPSQLMPGAEALIHHLAESGFALGLLSNAQCNTLPALGEISGLFDPNLTLLSYQHGIAKPAPELFQKLAVTLADRGIAAEETLFIGNDPRQDIFPAQALGFKTAMFLGHPDSLRSGECLPDYAIHHFLELIS